MDYFLKETSPWIKFDIDRWKPLLQGFHALFFRKNSVIYSQGQPANYIYIISSGRVGMRTVLPNGNEKQIYIGDAGSILGEISCIRRKSYIGTAIAESNSQVYEIPYQRFHEELKTNWEICELVLNAISRKAGLLHYQVLELSFSSSLQKTALALLRLANDYGKETTDGIMITIKFTHEEVASLINVSRTTVSGIFSSLASDHIIEKVKGYYYIKTIEKLNDIAKGSGIQLW